MGERIDGRKLRYQQRHPELLEAATDYVLEHGFSAVSMRSLAAAVGVSHSTLLHHFGTRQNLIAEILAHIRGRVVLPLRAEPGALEALWKEWSTPDGQRLFRLLFEAYGQAFVTPDEHRQFLEHVVDDWLRAITQSLVTAGYPASEAPALATFLIAQVRGLQLDLLTTADHARVDRAFAIMMDTFRRQLAGLGSP